MNYRKLRGTTKIFVIVVLNDGETWGGVDGSSICILTEDQHEKLCDGYSPSDLDGVVELQLKSDWG